MLARTSAKLILWIIIPDGVTFKMFRTFCFLLFSSQLTASEVKNEINKIFQGLQLSKKTQTKTLPNESNIQLFSVSEINNPLYDKSHNSVI